MWTCKCVIIYYKNVVALYLRLIVEESQYGILGNQLIPMHTALQHTAKITVNFFFIRSILPERMQCIQ